MAYKSGRPESKRLLHIGVHNSANRNAGDTLLFPVVRHAFDTLLGPFDWELRQAWEKFTPEDAQRVNQHCDAIVLGGGGLFLRDQAGSDVSSSGWQWNSSVAAVEALEIPMVVFAVGYNRFRGQAEFDQLFTEHICALAEKTEFLGLRNSGSIRALSNYLPSRLTRKLRRQYCPTNVLWQLFPEYRKMAQQHDARNSRILAFNAAFDRPGHRFGERASDVLAGVARAVKAAEDRGWKILVAAHKTMDRDIEPYLDGAGATYDTVDLTDASPTEIMTFYANVDFAFGMRGHAQMIPFGLRRPILSIISHDKMRFLLEDLKRLEWGVEVDAPDLAGRLVAALHRVEHERANVGAEIARSQEGVWRETQSNLREIGRTMLGIEVTA
jgi:polysaccharide pyruvyl transferase WcaK-like protein